MRKRSPMTGPRSLEYWRFERSERGFPLPTAAPVGGKLVITKKGGGAMDEQELAMTVPGVWEVVMEELAKEREVGVLFAEHETYRRQVMDELIERGERLHGRISANTMALLRKRAARMLREPAEEAMAIIEWFLWEIENDVPVCVHEDVARDVTGE